MKNDFLGHIYLVGNPRTMVDLDVRIDGQFKVSLTAKLWKVNFSLLVLVLWFFFVIQYIKIFFF